MEYAIRWHPATVIPATTITTRYALGRSIPEAVEKGRSLHGHAFQFADKEYGILNRDGAFVPVPELYEPGKYTPEELEARLKRYYGEDPDKATKRELPKLLLCNICHGAPHFQIIGQWSQEMAYAPASDDFIPSGERRLLGASLYKIECLGCHARVEVKCSDTDALIKAIRQWNLIYGLPNDGDFA